MELTSSDHLVVETPENIRFGYDVADIGSRFLAIFIDTLIQGVLYFILFAGILFLSPGLSALDSPRWARDGLAVVLILVLFLIQFGYFIFLEIFMNGQTPGKRLFHLRVIKDSGYPFAPVDSIIRNLVRIIDFFPFAYGVGVIVMFSNARAKRLGDFAAGTLVVKMRHQVKLNEITPAASVSAPIAPSPSDGARQLDEADIALAESFLKRRSELTDPAPLTIQTARHLAVKMQLPDSEIPTTPDAALAFIRSTVDTFRAPRA